MTPRLQLYCLAFAPLVRGAAKTAILGRNRVRGDMSKGRFTKAEIRDLLKDA